MTNIYKKLALVCTTIALFTFVAVAQTTLNIKVSVAEDDVEEYRDAHTNGTAPAGYMDHGSSDLELTTEAENRRQMVGIVFRAVSIPVGATINSAYIQFTCDDDDNQEGPHVVNVWGIKQPNTAAPFTADPFNVTSRPKTTATVAWTIPVWATKEERGPNQKTSDLKAIVQEIIGQIGWAPGNNIGFQLTNDIMENIHREADAMDSGTDVAPELIVTYTAGGTGENKVKAEAARLVYPNPSEGRVLIKNPSTGNFSYAVYTVIGSLVTSRDDNSGSVVELDMSRYQKGTYIVEVKAQTITVKNKLILK